MGTGRCSTRMRRQPHPPAHAPPGESEMFLKLFLAIVIDVIGLASYLIPGLGETADFAWAPISSFLIWKLFGRGDVAVLGFAEEALPFLDFIPTACIAWYLCYGDKLQQPRVAKANSAKINPERDDDDADVDSATARHRKQKQKK